MAYLSYLSEKHPLEESDARILRDLIIEEDRPGSILRDFEILMDFIRHHITDVTKSNNLIPIKFLQPLNDSLTKPIEITLKRPQQQAFPHINGLYLLLVVSGIADFKHSKKKHTLVLNKEMLNSWRNLNPTERYFFLLESWLLRSRQRRVLGIKEGPRGSVFENCSQFWWTIPDKGLKIKKKDRKYDVLKYSPGFMTLALLELFGLLEIQHGGPGSGKKWRFSRIERLPFGDALFKLLAKSASEDEDMANVFYLEPWKVPYGVWQHHVEPFFPGWRNILPLPELEFTEGVYILKASIRGIWRRIAVSDGMTLDKLAEVILDAFDFDFDHLYEFTFEDRFKNPVEAGDSNSGDDYVASEVEMGMIPLQAGATMTFRYDFGDNWSFDVELESIDPVDPEFNGSKIIETHGESFPQYPDWDDWD